MSVDAARLKTPAQNGDVLLEPDPGTLDALWRANQQRFDEYKFKVCGVPVGQYRRSVRNGLGLPADQSLIVHGHQPEFYHCGVWAKSAVCRILTERWDAAGVQLIVDHDKIKSCSLDVPYEQNGWVAVRSVDITADRRVELYEQAPAWSPEHVQRVRHAVQEVNPEPARSALIGEFLDGLASAEAPRDWVDQLAWAGERIDEKLGIGQRRLRASEMDYGCFISELINNARRFAGAYNAALNDYRRAGGIRTRRHPVPDLEVTPERIELPLWIAGRQGHRERMHVAEVGSKRLIYAGSEKLREYGASELTSCDRTQERMVELTAAHRVRPRALALSLWMRLFLGDMFIHGIGGARYDQITDRIVREYFGVEPPEFCCVSATMWLDLPRYDVQSRDVQTLRRQLRDLEWNPQRYAVGNGERQELTLARSKFVEAAQRLKRESRREHGARLRTFREIRECNERLRPYCETPVSEHRKRFREMERQLRSNRVAESREYFYCLFKPEQLRRLQERIRAAIG